MRLLLSIRQFIRDFPRQFLAFCVSLLIVSGTGVYAATSYDVHNVPQMQLSVGINSTQTTGIKISGPVVNTVRGNFPTTSGGVLEISFGDYREHIYYDRATVNNTTKEITLTSGVIRDLLWNDCTQYTGDGTGRSWGKGAYVRLVDDCRLLNRKAATDRANTFTASGATRYSGSGSLGWPTFATTAERDRQLGANPPPGVVRTACVTGTGLCYHYIGGAWTAFGNTGVGNADTTTAGKVEAATIADYIARTSAGDSAALVVVLASHMTQSGSLHAMNNTAQAGRPVMLNFSGAVATSLGGTGLVNPSSGSVLVMRGSGSATAIRGANNGDLLQWDNNSWHSQPNAPKCYYCNTAPSTSSGTSMATEAFFDLSKTIATTDWVDGMKFRLTAVVTAAMDANDYADVKVKIGTTNLTTFRIYNANGSSTRSVTGLLNFTVKVLSVGASGTVYSFGDWSIQQGATESFGSAERTTGTGEYLVLGNYNAQSSTDISPVTQTIDMTASQVMRMSVTYPTASVNNAAQVQVFDVERLIP